MIRQLKLCNKSLYCTKRLALLVVAWCPPSTVAECCLLPLVPSDSAVTLSSADARRRPFHSFPFCHLSTVKQRI